MQGERELAADCRSLARFTLRGIPPMPAGMARLEVTFHVDADGLLHVTARELTTGIEQKVEVKPSYGLTDEEVERMLLDALDHGEDDFEARRLVDARVEAERLLLATRQGARGRRRSARATPNARASSARSKRCASAMREAKSASSIQSRIDELDAATHDWAGRRMNRAVQAAIEGRSLSEIARSVEHAAGVDAHLAAHERSRG